MLRTLRILLAVLLVIMSMGLGTPAHAEDMVIQVTEKIPWATGCTSVGGDSNATRLYNCTVSPGFGMFMQMISGFVKWLTFIVLLGCTLMLVYSGVQISLGGIHASGHTEAKQRISKVIIGIFFLFLVSFILNTLAPWVYR